MRNYYTIIIHGDVCFHSIRCLFLLKYSLNWTLKKNSNEVDRSQTEFQSLATVDTKQLSEKKRVKLSALFVNFFPNNLFECQQHAVNNPLWFCSRRIESCWFPFNMASVDTSGTNKTWELSLYELHRTPQEAITDNTEIAVSPRSLHNELMCPICLDMLKNTMTTKECLHRLYPISYTLFLGYILLHLLYS